MPNNPPSLQDFIELAQRTMASHGMTPKDSLAQSAGKMLQRLADSVPESVLAGKENSHEDMLQRCATHGLA
jgi:hypothetical protein